MEKNATKDVSPLPVEWQAEERIGNQCHKIDGSVYKIGTKQLAHQFTSVFCFGCRTQSFSQSRAPALWGLLSSTKCITRCRTSSRHCKQTASHFSEADDSMTGHPKVLDDAMGGESAIGRDLARDVYIGGRGRGR